MGVLDEAIREHLELKRRHGATDDEIAREEAEALGPARREPAAELEGDPEAGLPVEGATEILPRPSPPGEAPPYDSALEQREPDAASVLPPSPPGEVPPYDSGVELREPDAASVPPPPPPPGRTEDLPSEPDAASVPPPPPPPPGRTEDLPSEPEAQIDELEQPARVDERFDRYADDPLATPTDHQAALEDEAYRERPTTGPPAYDPLAFDERPAFDDDLPARDEGSEPPPSVFEDTQLMELPDLPAEEPLPPDQRPPLSERIRRAEAPEDEEHGPEPGAGPHEYGHHEHRLDPDFDL